MFQYKKTNAKGSITTPKFYNGMPFYFPVEVMLLELKDGKGEHIAPAYISEDQEELKLVSQFMRLCEDQRWLIQHREDTIKVLQNHWQITNRNYMKKTYTYREGQIRNDYHTQG